MMCTFSQSLSLQACKNSHSFLPQWNKFFWGLIDWFGGIMSPQSKPVWRRLTQNFILFLISSKTRIIILLPFPMGFIRSLLPIVRPVPQHVGATSWVPCPRTSAVVDVGYKATGICGDNGWWSLPRYSMGLVCLPNFMDGLVFGVHVVKDTIHCAFGIVKYMIYWYTIDNTSGYIENFRFRVSPPNSSSRV